jgi:hypothetical protein
MPCGNPRHHLHELAERSLPVIQQGAGALAAGVECVTLQQDAQAVLR